MTERLNENTLYDMTRRFLEEGVVDSSASSPLTPLDEAIANALNLLGEELGINWEMQSEAAYSTIASAIETTLHEYGVIYGNRR